jgi:ribosomal RNA-processing protein 8
MFAVPGWSVSSDSLKKETASQNKSAPGAKSRKRKRNAGVEADNVTPSNVADLWESVVEGKSKGKPKPDSSAKRQKNLSADENTNSKKQKGEKLAKETNDAPAVKSDKKDKKKKGDRKEKKDEKQGARDDGDDDAAASKSSNGAVATAPAPLPPAPPKLTPLQASMRQKLISARFRHLNETLYTRESAEAYRLFEDSPEMFGEYHEGFRRQVKVWPENPVDNFLQDIKTRAKIRTFGKGKPGASSSQQQQKPSQTALPRTVGTCTIADLGCGDARLAESLQAVKAKLKLDIKSYDLQSPSPLVTKADIANLPLADGSVNVAVFCLALMGTNWIDFIEEAYRILHWKGELWIAEIKSRFGAPRGKNAPVEHSVGNRRKQAPGKKAKDDGAFEDDLAVEVDGMDDRRRETDVSAFVDALRKRGFVLQGERSDAVDMSNKMFVKMNFIKGASPAKGKGVAAQDTSRPPKRSAHWPKPGEGAEEDAEINEASILKPCVYKIR